MYTNFVYEANQIILQLNATGDITNRYLWGPAVDQILADEQVTDPTVPGNILWPLTDHLNTVRDLAAYDADTGITTIVNHLIYDAYGRLVAQTDSEYTTLFAFTARPFDPATSLQNNLNRWYDPQTGRWLSEDPIGFDAADANLYRYVENMPTVYVDPLGLDMGTGSFHLTPEMKKAVQDSRNAVFTANLERLRAYLYQHAASEEARAEVDLIIEGLRKAKEKIDAQGGSVLFRLRFAVWQGPGALCDDCEQAVQENWPYVFDRTFYYNAKYKHRGQKHTWGEITLGFSGETLVTIDFWKDEQSFWRPGKSSFGYVADDDISSVPPRE